MVRKKDPVDLGSFHGKKRKSVYLEYDEAVGHPRLIVLPKEGAHQESRRFPVYGQIEQGEGDKVLVSLFDVVQDAQGSLGIPKDDSNPRVFQVRSVGRAISFVAMKLTETARLGLLDSTIVELVRNEFVNYSADVLEDLSEDLEMLEEEKPASPDADDEHDNVVSIDSARAGNNHG